jgi:hypothetical protein
MGFKTLTRPLFLVDIAWGTITTLHRDVLNSASLFRSCVSVGLEVKVIRRQLIILLNDITPRGRQDIGFLTTFLFDIACRFVPRSK